ncbi:MAG TPA: zinc-binding dehydrogenase [Solirubrobacterales bacterium]|nr:zinc-binding dehydrogenase [Solirubrobacterales bacterium]
MSVETEAIVLRGSGDPWSDDPPPFDELRLERVTLAEPGAGEVMVDVHTAAICHSDLSVLSGHRPRPTPMVLGHEASAVVNRVGEGVTRFAAGDRVLMAYVPSCGHCLPCVEGRPALCEPGNAANAAGTLIGGGKPFRDADGNELYHHLGLSAFSRQTVVSENSLIPMPEDMPLDLAALLGCSVLTGVGAAVHTGAVEPGMQVAVFGLGGVGLAAVIGARLAGAARILGVDVDESKFELARRLGASDCVLGGDAAAERLRELSGGGVDLAIDTAGVARLLTDAYDSTRRGGSVVVAGLANPGDEVGINPADLVATERTVRGSYMGSAVPARDAVVLTRLYREGELPLEDLVGDRIGLADVPAGFAKLHRGHRGRQLIGIGG